jgi:hypothetical protein
MEQQRFFVGTGHALGGTGRRSADDNQRYDEGSPKLSSGRPCGQAPGDPEAAPVKSAGSEICACGFQARGRKQVLSMPFQHHANTVFRGKPFSNRKFDRNISQVLSRRPRMAGIVGECQSRVIGLARAVADSYMLSDGPLFVTVQLIAVELEKIGPVRRAKAFLALVSGIRQWARSMNATHSFLHVTMGLNLKATDRLMKAAGAKSVGGAYVV